MHKIAILAPHGVIPFDLSTACDVLSRVRVPGLAVPYEVKVCGEAPSVAARHFDLHTRWRLHHASGADTLIIPGIENIDAPMSEAVLATIRTAADDGARIASICSGAFLLAASGVLSGRRPPPTGSKRTNWRSAFQTSVWTPTYYSSTMAMC